MTASRLNLQRVSPKVYQAMIALHAAAAENLDPTLAGLIMIRASQLNHCAFCVDMHTHDARQAGETEQRIYLLSAWEEAGTAFTEREQAALALTESITELIGRGHVPDEVYARAAAVFSETELAQVISMATVINAWNRIGVTTRKRPPLRR
ncbi:carboxymuconolactone decarboxylase family protein [Mycolicibacterium brumae]|uniref:Carboxymuconolactone decarboxylase family protein n=1 Tax=Mycolicibacterium brumae TaxID=85968 RepID=A0A2G5P670_9MYCO|nr:carboxymuconolactone decarboxylase family protein [Mycolicibacterium brumae]MCV7193758.1 carboxymuconolactone decarboxylase family protein [Mycolicibacterium brumae]PIB73842.1 carboxymuconolactone decarboxylase family protein [Mycolicibacterium brumae]RWA19029.1 hypothetical protein MBRU_17385 [Mycolicibacterium brumae DSM 44177]UWW08461.1 carboxymuconolactone decarboxylase family protein [Mycolicibacterium brumae]